MKCSRCGTKAPKGTLYCAKCGFPLGSPQNKKGKGPLIAIIVLCVVALLVVAGAAWYFLGGNPSSMSSLSASQGEFTAPKGGAVATKDGKVFFDQNNYYTITSDDDVVGNPETGGRYVRNEVLIYANDALSASDLNNLMGEAAPGMSYQVSGVVESIDAYQIRFEGDVLYQQLKTIVASLEADSVVAVASLNTVSQYSVEAKTQDPAWTSSSWLGWWSFLSRSWALEAIEAPAAWDMVTVDSSFRVGVFDTQFDWDHEDLTGMSGGTVAHGSKWSAEDDHGTHVAGIIGATSNDKGSVGVAYGCTLYGVALKTFSSEVNGEGVSEWSQFATQYETAFSFMSGISYLISNDCKVVNVSLGYAGQSLASTWGDQGAREDARTEARIATQALKKLRNKGQKDFVICVAAGNEDYVADISKKREEVFVAIEEGDIPEGSNLTAYYSLVPYTDEYKSVWGKYSDNELRERLRTNSDPSFSMWGFISDEEASSRIVVVGAVEKDGSGYKVADYSNQGQRVDVLAPGTNVYSTLMGSQYGLKSGTSMASPMVAGVAALVWSANSDLSGSDVKKIIVETAQGSYENRGTSGRGIVNARAAVERAQSTKPDVTSKKDGTVSVTISGEKNIELLLDISGSMDGKPLSDTKSAATSFVSRLNSEGATIGLSTFESNAREVTSPTTSAATLTSAISALKATGSTNMEGGLSVASSALAGKSGARAIVMMTDGKPNVGKQGNNLISYAKTIRDGDNDGNDETKLFILGFNEDASGQSLLRNMASAGYYYSIKDSSNLQSVFDDMADALSGTRYMYVRVACPVDVIVTYNGETLSSAGAKDMVRTSFGSLTFEEEEKNSGSSSDPVKVLRLKEGVPYEINIQGTGNGTMDYSIGFADDEGHYSDSRTFEGLEITPKTQVKTVAETSDMTTLKVDEDGDGVIDRAYTAGVNGKGQLVNNGWIVFMLYYLLTVVAVGIFILLIIGVFRSASRRDR